jgi:hypothetical protein
MNLDFIHGELVEARMFFGPDNIKGKSAEQISDIIYLLFMMIEVIRYYHPDRAAKYADETLCYSTYENMHYAGTDLGNLLAVLNNQDTFKAYLKTESKISIPLFQINRYLQSVRSRNKSNNDDATFFWKLEEYLKLYSKSLFRQLRRDAGNWKNLTRADKVAFCQILRREFDSRAGNADIYLWFKQSFKLGESVNEAIDTKLDYHKFLNPALWENEELKVDVKDALGKIANKFAEFVDVKLLKITDYIITGSNCGYNYTSQSDIDLHILVDATALGDNPLTEPFLKAKKSLWNSGHDITVKGFTVELYAEDVNNDQDQLVATGVYSLLHDEWIKKPTYEAVTIDDQAVQAKAEGIMQQIDMLVSSDSDADADEIASLWEHIRKMRRAGLEKGGEFSIENLAFKAVRNNGAFDKLRDYENQKEDEDLTLEAITSPIRDNDVSSKSTYFTYNTPVIDKVHGLELKKVLQDDELYYGLFDPAMPVRNTLVGLLQLEKYNDSFWQVRLVQIEEKYKSQGYGTYLYDYAVMNDGLSILSDTNLTEGGDGGSKGLWEKLYRHGRYTVCGYNLDTNEVLPNLTPAEVFNQHEDLVCLATPKMLKESINEMLTRIKSKNKHRSVEWYGPSVSIANEF